MSYNKLDPAPMENPFEDDFVIEDDHPSATTQPLQQLQALPVIVPDYSSQQQQQQQKQNTFEGGLFSINHYRQYFDLNTNDFFINCYKSVNPFNKISEEDLYENGDLYGSTWITGTLIFLLFFCNSLSVILSDWVFDKPQLNENYFQLLIFSINLLYGYLLVIPVLTYLALRFYFKVLTLTKISKLISIYGYSNIWWIPLSILSIVRGVLVNHKILSIILKWCLVGGGGLLSGLSIFIKLIPVMVSSFQEHDLKSGYLFILVLVLCHVGFTIGVKVSFFGALV